jgi:hypothetical protein
VSITDLADRRPTAERLHKSTPPARDAGGIRSSSEFATTRNAAAVVLQPLQGVARGLIPIDWAAIWYQLVDLKTVTRRAALRLLRLAFVLTCDLWRTE